MQWIVLLWCLCFSLDWIQATRCWSSPQKRSDSSICCPEAQGRKKWLNGIILSREQGRISFCPRPKEWQINDHFKSHLEIPRFISLVLKTVLSSVSKMETCVGTKNGRRCSSVYLNATELFYTERQNFKQTRCIIHSAINATTWEWTRRHSERNHETQHERWFSST